MSRKSINKAKQKRLQEKRGRREANQRRYEAYAAAGTNTKSKRFRRNSKATKSITRRDTSCRNIGDTHHHWALNLPFLVWTYLLYREGCANQWTAKCAARVSAFVDQHQLRYEDGRIFQYNTHMTPARIRALA